MRTSDTTSPGTTLGGSEVERDRELVARCQRGDAEAFAELYDLYYDRLVRFCRRRLVNRHEAEDAAQDAFVSAWRAIDRLEPDSSFYPWLSVIAANRCTDILRKGRRAEPVAEVPLPAGWTPGDSVGEGLERQADAAMAVAAIARLTPRHRRVLHLREELGLSVAEIAETEGVSPNATDTLLWRARLALQREFRALVDGAAGLAVIGSTRFWRVGRRVFHPLARTASDMGPHNPIPWMAPITLAASLSVVSVVLVTHAGAPPAQPAPVVGSATLPGHGASATSARSNTGAAGPRSGTTPVGDAHAPASSTAGGPAASGGSSGDGSSGPPGSGTGSQPASSSPGDGSAIVAAGGGAGSLANSATGAVSNTLGGVTNTVQGVAGGVTNTVTGVTGGAANTLGGVVGDLSNPGGGLLGGSGSGSGSGTSTSGSGQGAGAIPPTTTPTAPLGTGVGSLVNGTTGTIGDVLKPLP